MRAGRSFCFAAFSLGLALLTGTVHAGSPGCGCGMETSCGCSAAPAACCSGHHGCHLFGHWHRRACCCAEKSVPKESFAEQRLKEIPYGPVVDSMAVMRMSPALMTMQVPVMMGGVQKVAFEQPQVKETSCETSHRDLRELEARIDALDKRTQVILRSIEFQTRFLEELKEGKIKLPQE